MQPVNHAISIVRLRLPCCGFSHVRLVGSGKITCHLDYHFAYLTVHRNYSIFSDKIQLTMVL